MRSLTKSKWIEKLYFIFISGFVMHATVDFFSPHSPVNLYYRVLRAFNSLYVLPYTMELFQIGINIIHLLPIFFVCYNKVVWSKDVWKGLFFARVILDIVGHSYYMNTLVAFYLESRVIFTLVFLSSIAAYIPSYFICFDYAFQRDKIIPAQS